MNDDEAPGGASDEIMRARFAALRQEHHDLDASITALEAMPIPDQLLIMRLKRKKLAVRDQIVKLGDLVLPDIIA